MKKFKEFVTSKTFTTVLAFLGLFLLATGISWAAFSILGKSGSSVSLPVGTGLDSARSKINLNLPRTEECPVNGEKLTKIEKDICPHCHNNYGLYPSIVIWFLIMFLFKILDRFF